MKLLPTILACVASGVICHGQLTVKPGKLPVDVQKHVDAIKDAARSNDWPAAHTAYRKIDWRAAAEPATALAEISRELKSATSAAALRREVKTKYELLRAEGDPDLDDPIAATPIQVVMFPVQRIPAVQFGELELVIIDVPSLRYESQVDVRKYANAVVFIRVKDEQFFSSLEMWERRFGKVLDYYDERGNRIVPAGGSVLWHERQAVIRAVENGGDYDALWDAYHEHLEQAIGRRINLKRKR